LYRLDRAAALVKTGSYKSARELAECVREAKTDEAQEDKRRLEQAVAQQIRAYCENWFENIQRDQDKAAALDKGLKEFDADLCALAQSVGQAPTGVTLDTLAGDILDAALGTVAAYRSKQGQAQAYTPEGAPAVRQAYRKPDLEHQPANADQFVQLMTSVPVEQWNTHLRDSLRRAFAHRYAKQATLVTDGKLLGFRVWLAKPTVKGCILEAEQDAVRFNELSRLAIRSETTSQSARGRQ